MAGMLLVPGPGWIGAIISMGFNIMLAWELYGYWKEFSNSPDSELDETEQVQQESITSPNITSEGTATPVATTPELVEGTDTPTARTPNVSDVAVSKIIAAQIGPVAAMNYLENIGLGREQTLPIREIVEGAATPAATTTPELIEGTAENVSTPPRSRPGFEGTTSGPVIPILNAKEKSERVKELAEQMNLDPANLDVEYAGQVPAVINGVAVPSELLTEDEKYQQNSAKAAREMLQGTQSEVAARQSVTSNAIQNMTNLSTPSTQSAPPIINNITNNNTSASSAAPQILTTPSTPRNNNNVIQRFQDKTFAGI
jgi:hypothetical protein